jgi:hypothetical protein
MLMKPKKQDAGAVYMSSGGPVREMSNGPMQEPVDQLNIAAEEIMSALEKKDVPGLREALKSFMDMCSYEEEED